LPTRAAPCTPLSTPPGKSLRRSRNSLNTVPRYINATGKTFDALLAETKHITAGGGTSIGCALNYALVNSLDADGIAIVSDGEELNPPFFRIVYPQYSKKFDKTAPVYFYQVRGGDSVDWVSGMTSNGHEVTVFDLRDSVDYYSLPNIIQTMRANRYALVDEVLATPLLTVNDVFHRKENIKYAGSVA
jgi:hypothetical protein